MLKQVTGSETLELATKWLPKWLGCEPRLIVMSFRVLKQVTGPEALELAWSAPSNLGLGTGVANDLTAYQVALNPEPWTLNPEP